MIPKEILKKIRQIEIRSNRLVSESVAGAYHSVFKGQGMNFDEVREYQPGDDVRAIDWNVTARTNTAHIKKFVEERELTVMLVVDVSASGRFGSVDRSKREVAAEIAAVLAFSAIRNNDKVGVILFSDRVEKYIPPKKGRRHVLRVIRDVLFFEPEHTGTNPTEALRFLQRVCTRKAIAVVISDFLGHHQTDVEARPRATMMMRETLASAALPALRRTNRKHDVVAIQIVDRFELELPAIGLLELEDAETGELVEINTNDPRKRESFKKKQLESLDQTLRTLRSARIDTIQLRSNEDYAPSLAKFFETRERRLRH
jgi:uncharacterized protein (DUF58 family)